jgi:hypothetical protein
MMYDPLMTLVLAHDYFDGPPPLRASLCDPAGMARAGVLAKPGPASLTLWLEAGEPRPPELAFDIWSTDPAILHVTPALAAEGVSDIAIAPATGPSEHRLDASDFGGAPGPEGRRALLRLSVTLPDEGVPDVRVVWPAVEAIWVYHVLGRPEDGLSVVDSEGEVQFDAAGPAALPDGRVAQCYRSDRPLALRARPRARFSLMRDGPFGPQTLVDALPGAGAVTRYAQGTGPTAQMQSDIYITL